MGEPMSDQSLSERVEADDTGDPATFNREWWDDITRHWNFPMGLFTQYESWQIAADEWSDGVSYEVRESDPSNPDFPWCEATLSGHLDGTPTALEVIVRALNGVPVLLAEVGRITAERDQACERGASYKRENSAWSQGVGAFVDRHAPTYCSEAANGPADLLPALDDIAAELERLRVISEAAQRERDQFNREACDLSMARDLFENEALALAAEKATAARELFAEHQRDEQVDGCVMCWPKDGHWPCTSAQIAADLAAGLMHDAGLAYVDLAALTQEDR